MLEQDVLFQLIKSLSAVEKRQFTKAVNANKKEAIYKDLFDAIDKQKNYEEATFKKKYKDKKFIKNLSTRKNELTEKLLEVLVGIEVNESTEAKIKHALSYLPILFKRKQFGLMRKRIAATKKTATQSEQFYLLLEVLEWEKKMVWNDLGTKYKTNVETVIKEQEVCLDKLNEQFAYRNLRRRIDTLIRRDATFEKKENIEAFNQLMKNERLKENLSFLSKEAEQHYYHIQTSYYRITQQFDESINYAKRLLELCEDNKLEKPNQYRMALSTYLFANDAAKIYDDFPEKLNQFETLIKNQLSEQAFFARINFYWLRYYLGVRNIEEALRIAKGIKDNWKEITPHIQEGRYLAYCFNLMNLYWVLEDLSETHNWLICIRAFDKTKRRKDDIVLATRLFELVFYYECQLQEKDQKGPTIKGIDLEKAIDNTRKTLKNNEQYQVFHQTVIQYCRELNRAVATQEELSIIANLENKLLQIQIESPNLLCLNEILLWCKSKRSKSIMIELYTISQQS